MTGTRMTIEHSSLAIALAIRNNIIITGTTVADNQKFIAFRNSGNVEGCLCAGDEVECADFDIENLDRIELVDGTIGRDGFGGIDEDVREFDDLAEAVETARNEFFRLAPSDKARRYFSVRVITDGEYEDEIVRFDGDLLGQVEGSEESFEDILESYTVRDEEDSE